MGDDTSDSKSTETQLILYRSKKRYNTAFAWHLKYEHWLSSDNGTVEKTIAARTVPSSSLGHPTFVKN